MKLKSAVVVPTKNKQDLFSTVRTKTNATKLKMKTQFNRYVSRLLKKLVILILVFIIMATHDHSIDKD